MSSDPSPPPSDLDAQGRRLYFKLRQFLKDQALWEHSDRYVLGQTCRYEQRARQARATMVVDGRIVFTSEGYKGQEVPSTALKTAETAEKAFMDGLKELGLTPRARKMLGIEPSGAGSGGKFGGAFGG